jgi:hypothetical protein
MDAILWLVLPFVVAGGSTLLSYVIMHARMEVAVAREREAAREASAKLRACEAALPDKIRAAEEAAHRKAFDQFLMDFRVEERQYIRESRTRLVSRKSVVLQERLYFRNIPLSNWVEHELPLVDGRRLEQLDQCSVFSAQSLSSHSKSRPKYLT